MAPRPDRAVAPARPARPAPPPLLAALAGVGLGALVALGGPSLGCNASSGPSSEPGDKTVGEFCDQLLPSFCDYAVNTCGQTGTVAQCIQNARPVCCQGACARQARPAKDLGACLRAYVGDEAGVDDAGIEHQDLPGLGCEAVKAGLAPDPCKEAFELLSAEPSPSAY